MDIRIRLIEQIDQLVYKNKKIWYHLINRWKKTRLFKKVLKRVNDGGILTDTLNDYYFLREVITSGEEPLFKLSIIKDGTAEIMLLAWILWFFN